MKPCHSSTLFAGLLFVLVPLRPVDAFAARTVVLSVEQCSTPPENYIKYFWPLWRPLVDYAQICRVLDEKDQVILSILIARLDRMDADGFRDKFPDVYIPKPVIIGKSAHQIGELPLGFPVQAPSQLRVTFSNWRQGFPWRIELYDDGVSALPPHPLQPMLWDPVSKTFR